MKLHQHPSVRRFREQPRAQVVYVACPKSSHWFSGKVRQSAATAKTLRSQAGKILYTDGPFAETKEHLG